jgi:hypothetical protein
MMLNESKTEALEELRRTQMLAMGKSKLALREAMFSATLFAALFLLDFLFVQRRSREELIGWLVVFPLGLLGGYLHGLWVWQDLTKKPR